MTTSISELFETDPLKLTREEGIKTIVNYYRDARLQFKLGDKTAGSTKRIEKAEKKDLTTLDLDL